MDAQVRKAHAFKALHEQSGVFVIPNPWDAGSAKMLASLGYQALATTSAGYAFSQGKADGVLSLDETLANVRAIVAATDLPVAVDLENGFADDPAECAKSLLRAAEAGAVGGSIEDATGRADAPIYCLEHAVARIEAAVAAVRSLPFPFILTARAENYLHGHPDLNDTIRRLQAFAEAGRRVVCARFTQRRRSAGSGACGGAETGQCADVRRFETDRAGAARNGRAAHQYRFGTGVGGVRRILPCR
jgi:2-methylisocitrate lyase-like PEP mutase family enzyme